MQHVSSTINLVIESIALMTLISFLLSITLARVAHRASRDWIMGAILGAAASLVQHFPISLGPDVFIDSRAQLVAAAGAFFGWRGAMLAVGCAVATRVGTGGIGTLSGVCSIIAAGGLGLAWRAVLPKALQQSRIGPLSLGAATTLHLIVPLFFMPSSWWAAFYQQVGIPLALSELVGITIFGTLIQREYRLHDLKHALHSQAMIDPLTGLANRRHCVSFFEDLSAEQLEQGVALLYLDVDHFKPINDNHGHDVGDAVLRQLARILDSLTPEYGCAARLGGEEFCLLTLSDNIETAAQLAERIRRRIAKHPFQTPSGVLELTISIGLHHSRNLDNFDNRLNAADRALYAAKSGGRNRVERAVPTSGQQGAKYAPNPARSTMRSVHSKGSSA